MSYGSPGGLHPPDGADAHVLFEALDGITIDGFRFGLQRLTRGEALLRSPGRPRRTSPTPTRSLSKSIRGYDRSHSRMQQTRPRLPPLHLRLRSSCGRVAASCTHTRSTCNAGSAAYRCSTCSPRNGPAWCVRFRHSKTGRRTGAAVTSSALYRGLAATLGLISHDIEPLPDPGEDLFVRFETAATLLDEGAQFVHVHTKAADEAGHTKDPREKMRVLQLLDEASRRLHQKPFLSAVVVITGDHAHRPSTASCIRETRLRS